jgi:hypothetical protein
MKFKMIILSLFFTFFGEINNFEATAISIITFEAKTYLLFVCYIPRVHLVFRTVFFNLGSAKYLFVSAFAFYALKKSKLFTPREAI